MNLSRPDQPSLTVTCRIPGQTGRPHNRLVTRPVTGAGPYPEIWKPIPGWPYEACNLPPSITGYVGQVRNQAGLILKDKPSNRPTDGPPFYRLINLRRRSPVPGRKSEQKTFSVHSRVMLAHEGERPDGKPDIRHLDDNPENNLWLPGGIDGGGNLVYGDQPSNERDKKWNLPSAPPPPPVTAHAPSRPSRWSRIVARTRSVA